MCALFFYALLFVISCFHVAALAYCILRKRITYMLLWSWQHVEEVCSMQLFNRSDKRQESGQIKAVGCW